MITSLAIVTLLISIAGAIYLSHVGMILENPEIKISPSPSQPAPVLIFTSMTEAHPVAISAGANNDFYVIYPTRWAYYQILDQPNESVKVEELWSRPLGETPTAIHFVLNANSPLQKKILLAYPNRLEIFDPNSGQIKGTPFVTLENSSRVTGIATDAHSVYLADAGLGLVHQFDSFGKRIRTIGAPDKSTGFDGFAKGSYAFFDLDIFSRTETLYVTRPDRFRVEAFSVTSGAWDEEKSWTPSHKNRASFTGEANPAVLITLGDGSFLTTDAGATPNVKNFDSDGSLLAEIDDPEITKPLTDREAPLLGIIFTSEKWNRLLILTPNGKLGVLTVPP